MSAKKIKFDTYFEYDENQRWFKLNDLEMVRLFKHPFKNKLSCIVYTRPDEYTQFFTRNLCLDLNYLKNKELEVLPKNKIRYYSYDDCLTFKKSLSEKLDISLTLEDVKNIKKVQDKEQSKVIKKFGHYEKFYLWITKGILKFKYIGMDTIFEEPILFGENKIKKEVNGKTFNILLNLKVVTK